MDKIWLDSYPSGIPATINFDKYESLVDYVLQQCERYSEHAAYENFGSHLTYRELEIQSGYIAAYFQKDLQLKKGDRVAIMLPNLMQYPIVMLGILRAGLIAVNINPMYTSFELARQLEDCGAVAIVVLERFAKTVQKALKQTKLQHVITTKIGDCLGPIKGVLFNWYIKLIKRKGRKGWLLKSTRFKQILKKGRNLKLDSVQLAHDDVALLQYTGGTTGEPKAAVLSHLNLLANVSQCLTWFRANLNEGEEVVVTALPLYHVFSLTCSLIFLGMGATALLITDPRNTSQFVRTLSNNSFSVFIGLNTLFNSLLHNKHFKKVDFFRLKLTVSGGMALKKAVADDWQKLTGNIVIEGYGLTETSPVVCINPLTTKRFNGSVGLPTPATEVSIRNKSGKELVVGKIGELWVRGPQVMQGYWNRPEESSKVLLEGGWLRTGDIARVDERGFVYLVDREKDMINVSGFNVYPSEIEDVIMHHPDVKEVAVVGAPSDRSGEEVKAFVVKKNKKLTEAMLLEYCHEHLTNYKIPSQIEFYRNLPKSSVGKVLHRVLRGK
jgi:long-chain acyl-CoA synthetase